jgi:hypothetical protein
MSNHKKAFILTAVFAGLLFYAQFPFPALTDNLIWISACFFLLKLLSSMIVMRLVFDFLLKKYMGFSYKKTATLSFIALVLCNVYETVKHYLFHEAENFPFSLLPIEAFLVGFIVWLHFYKEKEGYKLPKILSMIIIIIIGIYSVFCEVNIISDLVSQIN